MDFIDRHPVVILCSAVAFVLIVLAIGIATRPPGSYEQRHTKFFTKTTPTGQVLTCAVYDGGPTDSITCNWPK